MAPLLLLAALLRAAVARPSAVEFLRLMRDLDAEDVAVRDAATEALLVSGEREALAEVERSGGASPEVLARVRKILDDLDGPVVRHPAALQRERALHALNLLGSR